MSDSVFMVREPGIYLFTGIATSRIKNYKHLNLNKTTRLSSNDSRTKTASAGGGALELGGGAMELGSGTGWRG